MNRYPHRSGESPWTSGTDKVQRGQLLPFQSTTPTPEEKTKMEIIVIFSLAKPVEEKSLLSIERDLVAVCAGVTQAS